MARDRRKTGQTEQAQRQPRRRQGEREEKTRPRWAPPARLVISARGAGTRPPRYFEPLSIQVWDTTKNGIVYRTFTFVLGRLTSRRRPAGPRSRRRRHGRGATTRVRRRPCGQRARDRPVHSRARQRPRRPWRSAVVPPMPREGVGDHAERTGGGTHKADDRQPPRGAPQRQHGDPATGVRTPAVPAPAAPSRAASLATAVGLLAPPPWTLGLRRGARDGTHGLARTAGRRQAGDAGNREWNTYLWVPPRS